MLTSGEVWLFLFLSLHAQAVSLHSFWEAHPCFYFPCASFSHLSSGGTCSPILFFLLDLLCIGVNSSLFWRGCPWRCSRFSGFFCSFRAASHEILPSRSLKKLKSLLLQSRILISLVYFFQDLKLHHLKPIWANDTIDVHIPYQFFIFSNSSWVSPLFSFLFSHQETVFKTFQKSLGLLVAYCLSLPTCLKSPVRAKGCDHGIS